MRAGDLFKVKNSMSIILEVANISGDKVSNNGFPQSLYNINDCEVIYFCTDEEHIKLLKELAKTSILAAYELSIITRSYLGENI